MYAPARHYTRKVSQELWVAPPIVSPAPWNFEVAPQPSVGKNSPAIWSISVAIQIGARVRLYLINCGAGELSLVLTILALLHCALN